MGTKIFLEATESFHRRVLFGLWLFREIRRTYHHWGIRTDIVATNRKLFPIVPLLFALFVVCFVFARGFDDTRLFLNGATPARFEFSGGNVRNLILVRSGEHALLLFDRDLQQFTFVKFDELKSIVWQRLPLRKIKITQ
ncbi:hypothetical protein [Bradyrhizobium sp. LB11.1]|uniref:hypothetical protein n=1 Tax=Bradyrhizobium sp. LB11.1 TaxID=3156326 RepID=UPI003398E32A